MKDSIFLKLGEIKKVDDVLQIEIQKEQEAELDAFRKDAERKATFKVGDIVRGRIGRRKLDQALMIAEVHYVSEDDLDGFRLTSYAVIDKEGRKWGLTHYEGTHEEADPEAVRLIKMAGE